MTAPMSRFNWESNYKALTYDGLCRQERLLEGSQWQPHDIVERLAFIRKLKQDFPNSGDNALGLVPATT